MQQGAAAVEIAVQEGAGVAQPRRRFIGVPLQDELAAIARQAGAQANGVATASGGLKHCGDGVQPTASGDQFHRPAVVRQAEDGEQPTGRIDRKALPAVFRRPPDPPQRRVAQCAGGFVAFNRGEPIRPENGTRSTGQHGGVGQIVVFRRRPPVELDVPCAEQGCCSVVANTSGDQVGLFGVGSEREQDVGLVSAGRHQIEVALAVGRENGQLQRRVHRIGTPSVGSIRRGRPTPPSRAAAGR